MSRLLDRFYTKSFIGISQNDGILEIGVLRFKSVSEMHEQVRRFDADLDDESVESFLQSSVASTPLNYIAVLGEEEVGALPTCSVSKAIQMDERVEHSRTVCVADEWMDFMDETVLDGLQTRFAELEPDAIYTPFSLLHASYDYRMQEDHAAYLLISSNALSLAVVKERSLRFASFLPFEDAPDIAFIVDHISETLSEYYGRPCCRGEFIEAVVVVDSAGLGDDLTLALEAMLLVAVERDAIPSVLLAARTCARELGYGL